ncbi:MAG: HTH domain-containing protein [Candidatus Humimicrobiia bacterium]
MNFKEAAYHILRKRERPLSAKEITQIALKEGLITSEGKTPKATMGAVIYTDIKQIGEKSLYVKVKRGLFGLREWIKETHEEKGETIKIPLGVNLIVKHLKETQFKSDFPTDFEEAIKDAFSFLGFEGELIGGKGDTDVLLTANIGQESFKVNVDGKTSKSGKIIDRQIDWISLRDHKKKNKADFVVVVGPSFSGGNLEERANEYDVSLLKTEDLIKIVEAHSKFPFTLAELKDLFTGKGDKSSQFEDLLTQNLSRRNLLEQFRVIIEEMQSLQDRLGYFTFDSLAGREKIEELEIELEDIEYIISLLKLPFVNGVKEISENKYILTIRIKDVANIFQQISNLLVRPQEKEEIPPLPVLEIEEKHIPEKKFGSKYFRWYIKGHSVVALAKKDNPYKHYCPMIHFEAILKKIIEGFKSQNLINNDLIFSMLEGQNLSPDRPFKGKSEEYKIRMTLGIFEIEGLIKWTGSKRPIEYKLNVPIEKINVWIRNNIKRRG